MLAGMSSLRFGWCLVGLAAMLATSASASAQAPDQSPDGSEQQVSERDEEARGLFLAGSAALDHGHFDEALDYFQRAYQLSGRPGLLFNIGHTAQRLRRDELALQSFEQYLQEVPDAENRDAVEARIRLLRDAIADRERQAEPTETPASPPAPQQPPDEEGPGAGPFVVMGIGGAAAITGVVLLALASSAASNVDGAPEGTPWTDVSGDYDSAGTLGVAGGIALGVGAAAVAAGLGWLIAGGSGEPGTRDAALRLGPTGIDLRGTF